MSKPVLKPPFSIEWPDNSVADNESVISALRTLFVGSDLVRPKSLKQAGSRDQMRMAKKDQGSSDGSTQDQIANIEDSKSCNIRNQSAESSKRSKNIENQSTSQESGDPGVAAQMSKADLESQNDISGLRSLKNHVFIGMNCVMRAIEDGHVSLVLVDAKFLAFSVLSRYLGLLADDRPEVKICKINDLAPSLAATLNMRRVSVVGFVPGSDVVEEFASKCSGLKSVRFTRFSWDSRKTEEIEPQGNNFGGNDGKSAQKSRSKKKRKRVSDSFSPASIKLVKKK